MTLEIISLPTGPVVVESSTSRVEFSPSQVREAALEGLRCLQDGGTLLSPNKSIGYPHIYHNYPRRGIKQHFDLPPINFPGDSSQPLYEFPILRNPQGELFRNGVKLAQGKNPDRVVFRQVTGESNKAEFVGIISHASAKDNNLKPGQFVFA